jgi:hypothetical protein
MLRRALLVFATVLVAAGCSGGPDAQRAHELLAQAQAAEAKLASVSYELEFNLSADGKKIAVTMAGGAYVKGKRAGDQYLHGRVSGAPIELDFDFVSLGKRAYVRGGGSAWQAVPRPELARSREANDLGSAAVRELTRYVTDVRVKEGQLVAGEPAATISGTIDTEGLVKAASRLQGFSSVVGDAAPELSSFAEHLGETHAVLVISERTRLLRAMLIDLTVEQDGEVVGVQVIYRLRDVNKPVRIPRPV